MMTIRAAQLQALGRAAFERSAVAHVSRHFPRHVAALGPQGTLGAVDAARRAAIEFGFDDDRDILRFIDLTFMFGHGFHGTDTCGWAAPILDDRTRGNARNRMDRLYAAAIGHLRRLAAETQALTHV
jgi:hypothetical protein